LNGNVPGNAWTRILESANEAGLRIDPNSRIEGNVLFSSIKEITAVITVSNPEDVLKIQAAAAEAWEYYQENENRGMDSGKVDHHPV